MTHVASFPHFVGMPDVEEKLSKSTSEEAAYRPQRPGGQAVEALAFGTSV